MIRNLAHLSSVALLAAAAHAQCLQPATGSSVVPSLVPWSSAQSYAYTGPIDDEGITPPIALTAFANFPMAGAVGNLDTLWVSANGHVWLTDSTLALLEPADGGLFGLDELAEMRGSMPGASARIAVLGDDQEAAVVSGAAWDIAVDQTVAGQVRITWTDITRWLNTTDKYSIGCTLFANGAVQMDYGNVPFLTDTRYVGISIGNGVGSAASAEYDLSGVADSGTEGLIFQAFGAGDPFDLVDSSLLLAPNGSGGYTSAITCGPARHSPYGSGCYSSIAGQVIYQTWTDPAPSAAALPPGTSITYTPAGTEFVLTNGGGTYFPPASATGTVTPLVMTDDSQVSVTPSVAFPYLGGSVPTLAVGSNGWIAMAAAPSGVSNNGYGLPATMLSNPVATFRSNSDYNPAEAGSGQVKWFEETIAGDTVLFVTWDGVERYSSPVVVNPETFQFQLTLAGPNAGRVVTVWQSMTTVGDKDLLVGYAPAAPNLDPGSIDLATALPMVTMPDVVMTPMTLGASPAPVINPSTAVSYTANDVPEFQPSSGIYLATMFFSVNPLPGGLDLAGILTGMPGCKAYIATLDVDMGAQVVFAPTITWNFTFDNVVFAPGNVIAAQAVALFDGAFPLANGEAGGFVLSNGVLSTVQPF